MTCHFTVPGRPLSKGSMRPVTSKTTGKVFLKPSNPNLKLWTSDVKAFAAQAWKDVLTDGPVWLDLLYRFSRPKSHYGTGKNASVLKPGAPKHPIGRPDIDKLERAVLDALTGVVYRDDSQVVSVFQTKEYDKRDELRVVVTT